MGQGRRDGFTAGQLIAAIVAAWAFTVATIVQTTNCGYVARQHRQVDREVEAARARQAEERKRPRPETHAGEEILKHLRESR